MESSFGILMKGYPFFINKFRKEQTDILQTRLLLQETYVLKGREAAKLFYDQDYFIRKNATPKRFQKTLFGEGGVQGMDGENHRYRKSLFMKRMNPESLDRIEILFTHNWMQAITTWETKKNIVLFNEAEQILMKTACEWTGVPLSPNELQSRTRQISEMIDASGGIGWRHYKGRLARSTAEKWLKSIITDIRNGKHDAAKDSILYELAFHKEKTNGLLSPQTAAVEMLNFLRPIVAIARYIVFMAHALLENPGYTKQLNTQQEMIHWFVQEVRRHYPFFPFVAAKTIKSFNWHDVQIKADSRVLLDLYATNHDENLWKEPEKFFPERFKNHEEDSFELIPQGGGDFNNNHRCAGEWITIRLMEKSLDLLVNKMEYKVPPQNTSIALNRIPAIPESRFIMTEIKRKS